MKIKSITDVITNSSSEIYILKKENAETLAENYPEVECYDISIDSLKEYGWSHDFYCYAADVDYPGKMSDQEWKEFVEAHLEEFKKLEDCKEVYINGGIDDYEYAIDFARSELLSYRSNR